MASWLCLLVVTVYGATTTTTALPPSTSSSCDAAMSSFLQLLNHLPDCLSSLNQLISIQKEMLEIMRERQPNTYEHTTDESVRPRHCQDLLEAGDNGQGVRMVYPYPERPDQGVDVYCDQTTDGGGWLVFQHRANDSNPRENFYRPWAEYQAGFGNLTGEFWLGLDHLHALTNLSHQVLRVDLADNDGNRRWAKYSTFAVGPHRDKYRLTVSGYSGDAGDSMGPHNGKVFTTYDEDNDGIGGNCAERYKGAFWHHTSDCYHTNPNGLALVGPVTNYTGIVCYKLNYNQSSQLKSRSLEKFVGPPQQAGRSKSADDTKCGTTSPCVCVSWGGTVSQLL
ncbi:hypothetical protein Pmani_033051 [Petrolisthes manimaculis]|uniref:Fibrinogen C-terminal domain-containing protein n=1 Tax=Petrolisthes manimaculis TaxID=1843537 RepID=A0AAE1NQF7_9EUCA|nr:hypothetical protein Pmani_033051 [Petrolisthes manimaculis]